VAAHAADAWPTRDITFYVPYAPGGSADPINRRYAELTEKQLRLRGDCREQARCVGDAMAGGIR